ncbi:MAG: vanadium-dependent haloperoxidase [Pseudomonadota bacterium]
MKHTDIFSEKREMTMIKAMKHGWKTLGLMALALIAIPTARADVVGDWNMKANAIVAAAKLPPPPAYRAMAMVQTAVYEAVNAVTQRYPAARVKLDAAPGASVEAAVAQANCTMLSSLVASQQAAIDSACKAALSAIPDGQAKTDGIAVGEKAAAAVLALRAGDGAATPESYRPRTTPGNYVPTVIPAVPQWPQRKPWLMARADQFRPAPPPKFASKQWARDYQEIKAIGAKNSSKRTAEQTEIARFWEATGPGIYFPLARSVANAPGRELTQNARLFAITGQAMDDALIAVMDAKYHYRFWRPVTAIRNGDRDGNAATERDASWMPLIDTPMHPEYPCAHCIISGSVGAVLKAEIGNGPAPVLTTASPTANGATRSWTKVDDFVQEVANARVYDGVHYRTSTEVGTAMGKKFGELAATKSLLPAREQRASAEH